MQINTNLHMIPQLMIVTYSPVQNRHIPTVIALYPGLLLHTLQHRYCRCYSAYYYTLLQTGRIGDWGRILKITCGYRNLWELNSPRRVPIQIGLFKTGATRWVGPLEYIK